MIKVSEVRSMGRRVMLVKAARDSIDPTIREIYMAPSKMYRNDTLGGRFLNAGHAISGRDALEKMKVMPNRNATAPKPAAPKPAAVATTHYELDPATARNYEQFYHRKYEIENPQNGVAVALNNNGVLDYLDYAANWPTHLKNWWGRTFGGRSTAAVKPSPVLGAAAAK